MLELNFTPFPELHTDRLLLRNICMNDQQAVYMLRSNPEVMKYVPRPLVKTLEDAKAHIEKIQLTIEKKEGINWVIADRTTTKFIGIIGLFRVVKEDYRSEVGYMMLPEWQQKGIMNEALQKVIDYGFNEMRLHSIEAIIDGNNVASSKLLEKNKFRKEAEFKENCFFEGKFLDSTVYSLVKGIDYE